MSAQNFHAKSETLKKNIFQKVFLYDFPEFYVNTQVHNICILYFVMKPHKDIFEQKKVMVWSKRIRP